MVRSLAMWNKRGPSPSDEEGAVSDMDCLPPGLIGRKYYQPTDRGREKMLQQRMEEIEQLRKQNRK